jgi:hypothetical protein
MIFKSDINADPFNLGSSEQVRINQMIAVIETIADYKKKYLLYKPKGETGRSGNNTKN